MKQTAWTVALIAIALTALPAGASGQSAESALQQDWPQFRGPNRDGRSAAKGLLQRWPESGPMLLWSIPGVGKGFSHVTAAGDLVYVSGLVGNQGMLHAYSRDGKLQWEASYGAEWAKSYPGARSIPTVHDGLVYVASGIGTVSCFDALTGKPVWSSDVFKLYEAPQVDWGFAESLLIDGDNVICTPCGKKATMVALNRKTGEPVWASEPLGQGSSFCSPLLIERGAKRMIVSMTENAVVAFAAADGKLLWQHAYANPRQNHPVTPIYNDGLLYVTSGYGKGAIGLALTDDGLSVKQIWEQRKQDPVHGQAVLVDGYVYASSHQSAAGKWTCVELATGRLAWEAPGVGKGGSIIYADGLLYCYSEDGMVGLMRPNPEACHVISSFKVPLGADQHWAHPAIANGRLYIRHGDALMCYDIAQ